MIQKIINRICKQLDISILYHSKVGIKCTNQLISSEMLKYFVSGKTQLLPIEVLYIGFDGLKDSYTLLNTRIIDSPYFELMQMFQKGRDVSYSNYIARVANGTLDFRPANKVNHNFIKFLKDSYEQKINVIQTERYDPIKIITIGGKYFIADGKHTAAVCALIDCTVRCIDMSPAVYDSFFWWVYRKMLKNKDNFKKHIELFESIMAINRQDY